MVGPLVWRRARLVWRVVWDDRAGVGALASSRNIATAAHLEALRWYEEERSMRHVRSSGLPWLPSACAALLTAYCAAACSKCGEPIATSVDASGASVVHDGQALRSDDAVDASGEATRLDDLLHLTAARLAVSSKVDNPRDYAEHIADGRFDTAWNGKTGDLVGAWFGFRVPVDARVRVIELTVGYVATSKKGEDLFRMNHRISRVRINRNGSELFERTLDPDSRELQRISLDEHGGDFRIEVLDVKPGTRREWRELAISELRVFGIAGGAKRDVATTPRAYVGSFDGPSPVLPVLVAHRATASGVDLASICDAWLAVDRPNHAHLLLEIEEGRPFGDAPPSPSCSAKELELLPRGDSITGTAVPPAKETSIGEVTLLVFSHTDTDSRHRHLGVQYGGRTHVVGDPFDEQLHWDPCPHGKAGRRIHDARVEPGTPPVAVFVTYAWSIGDPFPVKLEDGGTEIHDDVSKRELFETRCTLAPGGPSCQTTSIAMKEGTAGVKDIERIPPLPW